MGRGETIERWVRLYVRINSTNVCAYVDMMNKARRGKKRNWRIEAQQARSRGGAAAAGAAARFQRRRRRQRGAKLRALRLGATRRTEAGNGALTREKQLSCGYDYMYESTTRMCVYTAGNGVYTHSASRRNKLRAAAAAERQYWPLRGGGERRYWRRRSGGSGEERQIWRRRQRRGKRRRRWQGRGPLRRTSDL